MRLDGEAVTVCSRDPGEEWGVVFKRAGLRHFHGHLAAERNREDWERIGRRGDSWIIGDERRGEENLRDEVVTRFEDRRSIDCGDVQPYFQTIMANPSRFTVGYALTVKKTESFLQPKLQMHARSMGIVFIAVDRNRPLEEQGPFDVILHKISGEVWQQQLKVYKQKHPEVMVLDPPECIKKVYNRQSMLQEVAALNLRDCRGLRLLHT